MIARVIGLICLTAFWSSSVFAQSPVAIDNSYSDWQALPSIATFSSYFSPYYYDRELDGRVERVDIEKSVYWRKGGTQISVFKSFMDTETLYFFLEVASPFASELSIFFYLYPNRDADVVNSFTLEVVPGSRNKPGAVLLWQRGLAKPAIVGSMRNSSIKLECAIPIDSFPKSLIVGSVEDLSLDLTSCYYESASGLYEEFFYSTVFFKDLLRPGDL